VAANARSIPIFLIDQSEINKASIINAINLVFCDNSNLEVIKQLVNNSTAPQRAIDILAEVRPSKPKNRKREYNQIISGAQLAVTDCKKLPSAIYSARRISAIPSGLIANLYAKPKIDAHTTYISRGAMKWVLFCKEMPDLSLSNILKLLQEDYFLHFFLSGTLQVNRQGGLKLFYIYFTYKNMQVQQ
jgi:hypothetical protein